MEKSTAPHNVQPDAHDSSGEIRNRSFSRSHNHIHSTLINNDPSFHDVSSRIQHPDMNSTTISRAQTPPSDPRTGWGIENLRKENAIILTPELFDKLYLNPSNNNTNDLRTKFGNPTPIALLGVLLTASPLSCELMGWRGAGGGGAATTGAYYFMGGFLMSLGGFLEFFLGNTFSFVVFVSFGGFWFTLGATFTPAFNAYGAYAPDPKDLASGLESAGFHASFGFFVLFAGIMTFIYLVCSLRTNVAFVATFTGLLILIAVFTGSYWNAANGKPGLAQQQQFIAGVFGLITTLIGWYIFIAQMLESVDFPIQLPVGDLSRFITSFSEKVKIKAQQNLA